ncbi:hypothetical protein Syun_005931 [Stephania yunnanensis]|uniref:Uncharacterized protein n=1 Tax=Stephania yunnanensis TaxID=152371 RepID=A0AAP0KWP8_9MAGN
MKIQNLPTFLDSHSNRHRAQAKTSSWSLVAPADFQVLVARLAYLMILVHHCLD